MNRAKENLIKITIITFVIWIILLIVGFAIPAYVIVSNVFFGIGAILLMPVLVLFFKNKRVKKSQVSKVDIETYLTPLERKDLTNKQIPLATRVAHKRNQYWISFSILSAILFIGTAILIGTL